MHIEGMRALKETEYTPKIEGDSEESGSNDSTGPESAGDVNGYGIFDRGDQMVVGRQTMGS